MRQIIKEVAIIILYLVDNGKMLTFQMGKMWFKEFIFILFFNLKLDETKNVLSGNRLLFGCVRQGPTGAEGPVQSGQVARVSAIPVVPFARTGPAGCPHPPIGHVVEDEALNKLKINTFKMKFF